MASFIPTLEVRCVASTAGATLSPQKRQAWNATVVAWLRFQPRLAAHDLPARAELRPGLELSPCDAADLSCLEESAEAEQELGELLGELE